KSVHTNGIPNIHADTHVSRVTHVYWGPKNYIYAVFQHTHTHPHTHTHRHTHTHTHCVSYPSPVFSSLVSRKFCSSAPSMPFCLERYARYLSVLDADHMTLHC